MSASSCRIFCVFGLVMAAGWFAAGCSSSKKIDVGTSCLLNSDCNSPPLVLVRQVPRHVQGNA